MKQFDHALCSPYRLQIVARLLADGETAFVELQRLAGLENPGSLGHHLEVLEHAGLVETTRRFVGKKRQTIVVLAPQGRERFAEHCRAVQAIAMEAAG